MQRYHWFSNEMSSEKWAQKFHTDDVSLHRSGQDSDSAWGKQIFHIARPIRSSSSLENKESSVPWRMEWLTFFNSCTCIRVTSIILFCPQWHSLTPKNSCSGWIIRIISKSGISRFTIWTFFWKRIWKKYFWQSVSEQKWMKF